MVKKFNEYAKYDEKTTIAIIDEAFVDFIDSGAKTQPLGKNYQIHINIPVTFDSVEDEWSRASNCEELIKSSEIVIDMLKDIDVAIKRVYDEVKILGLIYYRRRYRKNNEICVVYKINNLG